MTVQATADNKGFHPHGLNNRGGPPAFFNKQVTTNQPPIWSQMSSANQLKAKFGIHQQQHQHQQQPNHGSQMAPNSPSKGIGQRWESSLIDQRHGLSNDTPDAADKWRGALQLEPRTPSEPRAVAAQVPPRDPRCHIGSSEGGTVDVRRGFAPSEVKRDAEQRQFLTDLSKRIFSNPTTHQNGRKRSLSATRVTSSVASNATKTHPLQRGRSFHRSHHQLMVYNSQKKLQPHESSISFPRHPS